MNKYFLSSKKKYNQFVTLFKGSIGVTALSCIISILCLFAGLSNIQDFISYPYYPQKTDIEWSLSQITGIKYQLWIIICFFIKFFIKLFGKKELEVVSRLLLTIIVSIFLAYYLWSFQTLESLMWKGAFIDQRPFMFMIGLPLPYGRILLGVILLNILLEITAYKQDLLAQKEAFLSK